MKKPVKMLLVLVLVCAVILVPMCACSPKGAAALYALNPGAFERAASEAIAAGSGEGVGRPIGVREISVGPAPFGEGNYVEFDMGGTGFGPSTAYWGVMYSRGGPLGFQGVAQELVPEGDGWLWKQPGGDNWSRVTPLGEDWYFYEMHF